MTRRREHLTPSRERLPVFRRFAVAFIRALPPLPEWRLRVELLRAELPTAIDDLRAELAQLREELSL